MGSSELMQAGTTITSYTHFPARLIKPVLGFGSRALIKLIPANRLGDKFFSFCQFVSRHKRLPTSSLVYNDVLYRIKVSDEILDPLRVFVSDKEIVKLYVKAMVGEQYLVPTIKILRSVAEVKTYEFPPSCCIKPTHTSGTIIIRRNNEPVDLEWINTWFSVNHYQSGREANYKSLKPKVLIEPLVFGDSNILDYKIFCFQGIPKLIQVDFDRYIDHTRKYFDTNWNELDFSMTYRQYAKPLEKPINLDEMLVVAEKLSKDFSFVRIDLYRDGKDCKVGEITNCSESATGIFRPISAEKIASQIIFG